MAESSMKRCFTSIAGNSIGTFMKIKRMEAAAQLLVSEPQLSICEVAEAAGYEKTKANFLPPLSQLWVLPAVCLSL